MKKALNTRDLTAGAVLILAAAALLWFGRDLPMGQATRLGPGYVPRILGVLIVIFGIAIAVRAVLRPGDRITKSNPVGVGLVLGAILLFACLLERAGLAAASIALLIVSSIAAPDFRIVQSAVFAVCLTVACILLFVWGLGMNVRVLPW